MKNTINTMVDQLNGFASEVPALPERSAPLELGGQAVVSGAWPGPGRISPTSQLDGLEPHRNRFATFRRGDSYRARRLDRQKSWGGRCQSRDLALKHCQHTVDQLSVFASRSPALLVRFVPRENSAAQQPCGERLHLKDPH